MYETYSDYLAVNDYDLYEYIQLNSNDRESISKAIEYLLSCLAARQSKKLNQLIAAGFCLTE